MSSMEVTPHEPPSGMALVSEYGGIATRNKWLILGCVILSVVLAWSYCIIAPKTYRSEALILAEEQKSMEGVIKEAGVANLEQHIYLIQRQIMGRDFFGPIAKEFNLYPKELSQEDEDIAVRQFAGTIAVEMMKKERAGNFSGRNEVDAFTVSFMHQDPVIAMKVTARIAEQFVEENAQEREKSAEGTAEFLDDEVRSMKLELEKKEEAISQFKRMHVGELPQQTEANLHALDRLQSDINLVNESIQRYSDTLAMLEKSIQEYRLYGRQNSAFMTGQTEPDPLFRRIKELREKLTKLKAEFRDEYPEVILTKEEIREVEEQLVELYGPDASKPDKKPFLDPYLVDLGKRQSEAKSELNLLNQRRQILYASKKNYESRVERFPVVEQELLILERDYNNLKNNHAMLLDKRVQARVAEKVEKRHNNGKFRILDSASFPQAPITPNRPKIMLFALLLGCALGGGLSVIRERLTPQFRGSEDVELLMGPRLLAAIPDFSYLWNLMERQPQLPSSFLERQSFRGAERSQLEVREAEWSEGHPQNDPHYQKRFIAKFIPHSMAAEQYRVAAARLQLLNANVGSSVIAVTSALKGEGKTTTVINLGYTLARDFGKRVLLLECDFVVPELRCFMEKQPKYGLIDCLKGDVSPEEAMTSFSDIPCWIMPAGMFGSNSTELLKTGPLERVLVQLREKFDYILLNAPPIFPVATMNVLERHADLVLLVVRANSTSHQVVKGALGSLRASNPVHVILNCVSTQSLPTYMAEYTSYTRDR